MTIGLLKSCPRCGPVLSIDAELSCQGQSTALTPEEEEIFESGEARRLAKNSYRHRKKEALRESCLCSLVFWICFLLVAPFPACLGSLFHHCNIMVLSRCCALSTGAMDSQAHTGVAPSSAPRRGSLVASKAPLKQTGKAPRRRKPKVCGQGQGVLLSVFAAAAGLPFSSCLPFSLLRFLWSICHDEFVLLRV